VLLTTLALGKQPPWPAVTEYCVEQFAAMLHFATSCQVPSALHFWNVLPEH